MDKDKNDSFEAHAHGPDEKSIIVAGLDIYEDGFFIISDMDGSKSLHWNDPDNEGNIVPITDNFKFTDIRQIENSKLECGYEWEGADEDGKWQSLNALIREKIGGGK